MKKLLLIMIAILFPWVLSATRVSVARAEIVAKNFFTERAHIFLSADYNNPEASLTFVSSDIAQVPLYYVFSINSGGFVIVSASDKTMPILGYAYEGTFNKDFCNVSSWMRQYEQQISYAEHNSKEQDPVVRTEWNRLLSLEKSSNPNSKSSSSVAPLLISHWNQGSFYNGQCPIDPAGPDGHCYAGCVASAMGQLMYYYRFPDQGQGEYSYIHPDYGTIAADFDSTTYDWNGMPSFIMKPNFPLANLLFHLGVSVDMDYGPDGSGMWNHKAAYSLKTYFKYGPETQYYFRDSISLDWDSILIANLDQRKPLYYAGWAGVQSNDGHAFVCDGYQGADYFHFNWGWGGQSDGYFYPDNLNPGGSNFNFAQEVIPMFPDTLTNTYPGYCSGKTVCSGIRGSLEDGSGWASYQPNSSCSWLIHPQDPEMDSILNIKLTFLKMDTEPGNDLVYIYDGDTTSAPLLGSYSGNSLPPSITSTGNSVLIVFASNSSENRDGWMVEYESFPPVYCSGTTILSDVSGNLDDGSGPKNYNNNSICKWRIQPPEAGAVTLTFTSFELADSLDLLRVFDQTTSELLAVCTGSQVPQPITSFSGKMLIMFSTNKSNTAQGWEGYYTSSLVGIPEAKQNCLAVEITPNPVTNLLNLTINSPSFDPVDINIFSMNGELVLSKHYELCKGINNYTIDVTGISPSVYILKLTSGTEKTAKMVIID